MNISSNCPFKYTGVGTGVGVQSYDSFALVKHVRSPINISLTSEGLLRLKVIIRHH